MLKAFDDGEESGRRQQTSSPMSTLVPVETNPAAPVSILFEYYARERRMRVMRLFAEGTFDVDNALKSWLEEVGPDRIHNARPDRRSQP